MRIHALAALFLFGYVASFAHDVSVPHSICAEHGESIHGTSTAISVETALISDAGEPQVRSDPEPSEDPHEHCCLVVVSRNAGGPGLSSSLSISAPLPALVHVVVAYATPVREILIRSTPARGPPTNA